MDEEQLDHYRYFYISDLNKGRGLTLAVDMNNGFMSFFESFRERFGCNPVILSKKGLSSRDFDLLCSFLEPSQIFD